VTRLDEGRYICYGKQKSGKSFVAESIIKILGILKTIAPHWAYNWGFAILHT